MNQYGISRTILGLALLAYATALGNGRGWAADAPRVRFAACGTCTSEGVEGLILKQTNIAEILGLNLDVLFLPPPQMGAGIASESLDVEWVGDQPTLAQLANQIPIKITGYQFDFELRLEAIPTIESIKDLAGKRIGTPFGTTAYKLASEIVIDNGFPLSVLANVGPADLGTALSGGQIAAASVWDPIWGILEKTYHTKALAKEFHTGFVNMRVAFVQTDHVSAVKFLAAQMLAMAFRANNADEADRRYETAFGIAPDIAHAAQVIDRSYAWKDPAAVNLELLDKDYATLEATQAFLLKNKLVPNKVDVKSAIDMSLWKEARQVIASHAILVSQIRYVSNAK